MSTQKTVLGKEHFNENREFIGDRALLDVEGEIVIAADLGIVRVPFLKAKGRIRALAGSGISAGEGISAGSGISAGEGISAGFTIEAKGSIMARLRVFAGLCRFRLPKPEETQVRCRRLEGGAVVAFGTLIEEKPAKSAGAPAATTYHAVNHLRLSANAGVRV